MGYLLEIAKGRNSGAGVPVATPHCDEINELNEISSEPTNWPPASTDAELRFGPPHARLFPFLGRKVGTPLGPGTLIQVFSERVTVLLDTELGKCAFFEPAQIEPVSWEG
jgi:hypothetical protein